MKKNRVREMFAGKGFYIILFLCVAVIGISGYALFFSQPADDISLKNPTTTPWTFPTFTGIGTAEPPTLPPTVTTPRATAGPPSEAPSLPPTAPPPTREPLATLAATPPPAQTPPPATPAAADNEEEAVPVSAASFFTKPVADGILPDAYVENDLSYNATLGEWRFHRGIDIYTDPGAEVVAVADGRVVSINDDYLLGITVTVDHGNGLTSVYANLDNAVAVLADQTLKAGDTIGAVGATAAGELAQSSHLHFEMRRDGALIDPLAYIPK